MCRQCRPGRGQTAELSPRIGQDKHLRLWTRRGECLPGQRDVKWRCETQDVQITEIPPIGLCYPPVKVVTLRNGVFVTGTTTARGCVGRT